MKKLKKSAPEIAKSHGRERQRKVEGLDWKVEGATLPNNVDAVLDQIEAQQTDRFELEPNATSLKLLQKVYRSPAIALATRIRAAMAALQFEHPKLAVVATVDGNNDFAAKLDQALERSRKVTAPPMIEATAISDTANVPSDTKRPIAQPLNGHEPSVIDRRYRRW